MPKADSRTLNKIIGDSFYDHDYGDREKGSAKYIADREMMFRYMRVIIAAGVKSGTVHSTSERGEGCIMLSGSKEEKHVQYLPLLKIIFIFPQKSVDKGNILY